jgi:hypothetical protein
VIDSESKGIERDKTIEVLVINHEYPFLPLPLPPPILPYLPTLPSNHHERPRRKENDNWHIVHGYLDVALVRVG